MQPRNLIIAGLTAGGVEEACELISRLLGAEELQLHSAPRLQIKPIYLDKTRWHISTYLWNGMKNLIITVEPFKCIDHYQSSALGYIRDPKASSRFARGMQRLKRAKAGGITIPAEDISNPSQLLINEICAYLQIPKREFDTNRNNTRSEKIAA